MALRYIIYFVHECAHLLYIVRAVNKCCIFEWTNKQIFICSGKNNNKICAPQNKIRILIFSFLSFRLCLIITTSSAAEITSAGPVGHLNVRSQIESLIFSSNANRSPLWSITMLRALRIADQFVRYGWNERVWPALNSGNRQGLVSESYIFARDSSLIGLCGNS